MIAKVRVTFYALLIIGLVSVFSFSSVAAQDEYPSDDQVNAIARDLYCPVCENVPLDVCGTQACEQWRALIRELLAEGKSEDEIKAYFAEQYGARVLSSPPAEGLNWLVYIVPPAAFLAGVYILYRGFRTWRQIEPDPVEFDQASNEQAEDDYLARLEEELRQR
ncbi:MAG: cytochrome c-type biogenesis protein CcmH [Anaerolineales bacterium]|nr:cytochrome c-type biogenesis protein CcmH [Anaerolineales bacterium]